MQVNCVRLATMHRFTGNPIAAQHRLREREINGRLGWGMPSWDGEEFDAFDNRTAIYFIVCDQRSGDVLGSTRLTPTDSPVGYMLLNSFAHCCEWEPLPVSPRCAEGSRAVIDSRLPRDLRRRVTALFPLAYLEYAVAHGIEAIYGLGTAETWKLWTRSGWPLQPLGRPRPASDGTEVIAGKLEVSRQWLGVVRGNTGISRDVLCFGDGLRAADGA